uniref:Uncharacterized protein n=1 Tax=Tanacetum cinerariifolium TaxID=118510 RepID=A0A6L2MN18_TANCI|nr:hypothetical protein [Tanacetum cinerariifolium]
MGMFEARHHNGYDNVAWLIPKWLKRKGVCSQRESMICCGQFITRISKNMSLLTDEVLNGWSALVYCRYAGVFGYMAGQYNIPLQGAYAPPEHDEEGQQQEE